jgi:hypothetical protein
MVLMEKKPKCFDFDDFMHGLMLAGYVSPSTPIELAERDELEKYERVLEKEKSILFFKRSVLAAEITSVLHKEPTFGHVKLQKLMFLSEQVSKLEGIVNYSKQAAGPYDNKFMHLIDNSFEKQKWFNVTAKKIENSIIYSYSPSINFGKHRTYFDRYFLNYKPRIYWLIDIFGREKTAKVEIVATIFACWLDLLNKNEIINNNNLITLFYNWSEGKSRFTRERIIKAIEWMKVNDLIPNKLLNF